MTERERREGTGGTKGNVRDEHDEASKGRKKDATPGSVEEEASGGGGGPVEKVRTPGAGGPRPGAAGGGRGRRDRGGAPRGAPCPLSAAPGVAAVDPSSRCRTPWAA